MRTVKVKHRSEESLEALMSNPGEIVTYIPSKKGALVDFHKECTDKMHSIMKMKNADYSGAGDDPFLNFRRRGPVGFLVRMDDKLARIESFLEKGSYEVQDESFLDTCLDLANYAILLAAYMKQEANSKK